MSTTAGRWPTPAAAGVRQARALTPAESAWIALLPCAIAMLAAILVLGPPLGHVLFAPGSDALWPPRWWAAKGHAEPVKHGRYILAMLAPMLLVAVVLANVRRAPRLRPRTIRAITLTSQASLLAFVIVALLGQHNVILVDRPLPPIFSVGTLVAAAALVVVATIALRRRRVAELIARLARETTIRRVAGVVIAGAFSAVWLLEAITTDQLVEDLGQLSWTLNDAFAVLNGRTPLVDFHLIYATLLPYPAAVVLAAFGTTALVYTTALTVLSVLALLAVYAVFRRIARSSLLALGLFLPFVAASDIGHTMILPAMWPMRYGGAYLLAWLTARHVDERSPRRTWILFFAGGLVAINNLDFGVGALAASVAALLCARPPRSARAALQLGGEIAGGTLGAVAVVSLFTFVRAGALPDPSVVMEWPRIFTNLGLLSMPMPTASLHLVVYATFAVAVAVAAVRFSQSADDVLLTSMLMWSGSFGLVAGSYYVGRSDDLKLASMLSAWSFALVLLTVASARALAARGWRAPTLPHLLVLFGFGLTICSIGWLPSPQKQIARLTKSMPAPTYRATAEQFVIERTRRGDTVAILLPEGYRIAYELGLKNIAPYGMQNAIVTRAQMQTLIDTVRREHVREIFVPAPLLLLDEEGQTAPEQLDMLRAAGFPVRSSESGMVELRGDAERSEQP